MAEMVVPGGVSSVSQTEESYHLAEVKTNRSRQLSVGCVTASVLWTYHQASYFGRHQVSQLVRPELVIFSKMRINIRGYTEVP